LSTVAYKKRGLLLGALWGHKMNWLKLLNGFFIININHQLGFVKKNKRANPILGLPYIYKLTSRFSYAISLEINEVMFINQRRVS